MIISFAGGIALIFNVLMSFSTGLASAVPTNITIDDTNSTFWTYIGPYNDVTPSTPVPGSLVQPNPELAYNRTWHDGGTRSGTFIFQGSAVYVYGIDLPYELAGNISFSMNDPTLSVSSFHYGGTGYEYNSLFFSATELDDRVQHTVAWLIRGSSNGGGGSAVFDYAIVTVDQADTSSAASSTSSTEIKSSASSSGYSLAPSEFQVQHTFHVNLISADLVTASHHPYSPAPSTSLIVKSPHKSETGAIVGAVVGGIGALTFFGIALMFVRRSRSTVRLDPEPYHNTPELSMSGTDANAMGQSARPYLSPHGQSGPTHPFLPGKGRLKTSEVSRETMYDAPALAVSLTSPVPTALMGLPHDPNQLQAVEERLRNLEELISVSSPPAYI
ncbi:hypothetical protein K438DRAFT_1784540 [Mycena galopus ATCC 62051]|nr:hypothetical protein K438DRAFT_1784540 [Mycena galopus ATCC 62051]